jgi:hypothetical protein
MAKISNLVVGTFFCSLLATQYACSDAELGAGTATANKKDTADSDTPSTDERPTDDVPTGDKDAAKPGAAEPNGNAETAPTAGGDDVQAADHGATESEVVGCSLPGDVQGNLNSNPVGLAGLGLWGGASGSGSGTGTGGGLNLKNLDLQECPWFGLAQEAGEKKYIIIYTKGEQSFVELFPGPATQMNHAVCLQKVLLLNSSSTGGQAECAFLPE